MRIPRLASVALAPLVLYGCATHPVTIEPEAAAPQGHIAGRSGRAGIVVAAPHGTSDAQTGDIATEISRRTGFGLVVATGFSIEPDTGERAGRRYQVNRPLEGVPGVRPAEERMTAPARAVYEQYERRVREVSAGPLAFYVEIHGNGRRESAGRIEIATVGVDREYALQFRTLFELTRDAHLRGTPEAPRLSVLIEPADSLFYNASGAKRDGILRVPQRAFHIELPKAARVQWRGIYTAILADFVNEAALLRPLRSTR